MVYLGQVLFRVEDELLEEPGSEHLEVLLHDATEEEEQHENRHENENCEK